MKLADFEAHINVDGVPLPEYSCETDKDGEKVSCWIPSEAEKSFTVNWQVLVGKPYKICARVNIDGNALGGRIQNPNSTTTTEHTGAIISSTTERPFIFSSLSTTDDDKYLNDAAAKNIGDITVHFWEVVTGEEIKTPSACNLPDDKIHERSKKAMAHQVKLGEPKERLSRPSVTTTYIRLLATFVFKYRSIDILRAEGIAPPDPAAKKRKAGDVEDNDNDDEEEEDPENGNEEADQAELKALLEKVNVIQSKLAKKAPKAKGKKRVKTEPHSAFVAGEVIDLT